MLLPVVVVRRSVGSSDQLGALALWYLGLLGDTQSGGWDIVGWGGAPPPRGGGDFEDG
jgi:hypothetical protein